MAKVFVKVLEDHQDVFPDDLPDDLPPKIKWDLTFPLKHGTEPHACPLYRQSLAELYVLKEQPQ